MYQMIQVLVKYMMDPEKYLMNSDLVLLVIWKRWQKWTKIKQTPQQRKVRKHHILKLFGIWKLMHEAEETRIRIWVRPIFSERQRLLQGASDNLVAEMQFGDNEMFNNYCRMSVETFDHLLGIVGPFIEKQYVIRDPISARTRLLVCLRYLSSGDSMASIAFSFRIGANTVSKIISQTCEELWNTLNKSVFPEINEKNWLKIANEFATKWDFPHCIGAIDGKHVVIQVSRSLHNTNIPIYSKK